MTNKVVVTNNIEEGLPTDRSFGLFFSFIFSVLAIYLYFKNIELVSYLFLSLSGLLLLVSIFCANKLRFINRMWLKLGLLLGSIVSPVALGILFFLIISPFAMLLKIIGRDELELKHIKRNSHWKIRKDELSIENNFKNQF